jgi:AcrR family transcriptional regulator
MSESRAILLAAAAGEFAKYGPRGTRVQDIVTAAGINERMIYHHFGSKDGLYTEVMREQRLALGEAWQPALDKAVTMEPYPGMRLALGGFLDALLARPQAAALLAHEGLGDAPLALPAGFGGLPAQVRSLYERGQAEGVFPATVPFALAYATTISGLVAITVFARHFAELAGEGLTADPARFRDQIIDQVMNGMTGRPAASPAG